MIDKLKAIYGQALIENTGEVANPTDFYWFVTQAGTSFGLRKSAITDTEYRLLSLQCQPVDTVPKPLSVDQRFWHALLFENITPSQTKEVQAFSFLHIACKKAPSDFETFEEAINAVFRKKPTILWKSARDVVLILPKRSSLQAAKEFVDLIAADFYIDVSVLVGPALKELTGAHHMYRLHDEWFKLARVTAPERRIFDVEGLAPLVLVDEASAPTLQGLYDSLFQVFVEEGPEMRESLIAFYECGLNLTTAAKALYIHRNSLQYRLDRFSEKTGLDPKAFSHAVFIYMGLTAFKRQTDRHEKS
ncbi:PucR family transcriptional regulator [Camelliibacillus cellulosilyticus]|uniref:PucR family transcriptional regulator n=1 Tax=Camelliibacillus cellulosilyticus TaxID=2174486 RepID=A0ABV9GQY2_9BACL